MYLPFIFTHRKTCLILLKKRQKSNFAGNIFTLVKYCTAYIITWISYRTKFKEHTLRKPLAKYAESLTPTDREWRLESPLMMKPNEEKVDKFII